MTLTHRRLAARLLSIAGHIEQAAADAPCLGPSIHACALELQRLAERATSEAGPEPLTETRGRVLACIRSHVRAHGQPPTRQELGDALGMTGTAAHAAVLKLEQKGYLTRFGSGPVVARGRSDSTRGRRCER